MGHIYFVRHGQTVWNVENKICGATDIELTQLGHEQAKALGEEIVKQGIHIDEILYSPLSRARETARHISEMTGVPMREEQRLKEQNYGKYETTARNGEEFAEAKLRFIDHYESGETMFHLVARIYNLLDDIRKEADDKTYLLVAHNGISRVVQSYFYDMTNEEYAAFGIKNCEIRRYDFRKTVEVAAAIIIKDAKLFVAERGYGEFINMYELPGGKMEKGESREDALVREIKEELDTDIEVKQLVKTIEYDYPDFQLIMHCYLCKVVSGKLTLLEHKDAKWLGKEELDSVKWLPADEQLLPALQQLLEKEERA